MGKTTPQVDGFLRKAKRWQEELKELRKILLETELVEEMKWRQPCYTFEGKNVAILSGMKESCALAFFKGALMKDPKKILSAPGPNSQSGRWVKFTSVGGIVKMKGTLKAYVREAIALEKAGAKVKLRKPEDFELPAEVQRKFEERPELKEAFFKLTPGRQRAYMLHFSSAKQAKTREARVDKCAAAILAGKGMMD